jgi:hypothetical protein
MILKLLINNKDSYDYKLITENSVKKVLIKILHHAEKKDNLKLLFKEDFTNTLDFWITFLQSVGFKLEYDYSDEVIEFNNDDQNNLSFVLLYLSICNYHFGRKSIISNVLWMKQSLTTLTNNEIFMLSLYSTRKPRYNNVIPLVSPYNFKNSINKTTKIGILFKETRENFDHKALKDAVNVKNIKKIKNLL